MTPGQSFKRRGQLYRCLGSVEHQMRNGWWIDLYRLESACADCGRRFVCAATRSAIKRGDLNRRCDEHRRPGVPVGPPRRPNVKEARRRRPTRSPHSRQRPRLPTIAEMLA